MYRCQIFFLHAQVVPLGYYMYVLWNTHTHTTQVHSIRSYVTHDIRTYTCVSICMKRSTELPIVCGVALKTQCVDIVLILLLFPMYMYMYMYIRLVCTQVSEVLSTRTCYINGYCICCINGYCMYIHSVELGSDCLYWHYVCMCFTSSQRL